ncbi:TIGR02391 family protein [Xanthomonas oryzae]|uniref:TIGR02391 family protein n=1 Tax=Xanthomonas oryzae TaxID=347 RepID=UPI003AAD3D06
MSLANGVQQYVKAYDKAVEMFNVYRDAEAPELLALQKSLSDECLKLLEVTGLHWNQCGNLCRHLNFLKYYLDQNDKDACQGDIRDIVFWDLPTALRNLAEVINDYQHYDQKLKDGVVPLINGAHYDSAMRKIFVILTDRLRHAFGVAEEIDGDELVNVVFGRGGKIPVALDEPKKQAMRNLISGFYGVYRNRIAHNDVEPGLAQTRAIMEMANTIILDIEAIATASVQV